MTRHDNPPPARKLHQIAELLGLSVEHFYESQGSVEGFGDARECLHLWSLIRTETDRERVLAFMRGIANDERS